MSERGVVLSIETVEALLAWVDYPRAYDRGEARRRFQDALVADLARAEQRDEEPAPEDPAPEECPHLRENNRCEFIYRTTRPHCVYYSDAWLQRTCAFRALAAERDALRERVAELEQRLISASTVESCERVIARCSSDRSEPSDVAFRTLGEQLDHWLDSCAKSGELTNCQVVPGLLRRTVSSMASKLAAAEKRMEDASKGCPYSDDGEGCPMVEEAAERCDKSIATAESWRKRAEEAEAKARGCFRLPEINTRAAGQPTPQEYFSLNLRVAADVFDERRSFAGPPFRLLADAIERGPEGGEGVWVTREQVRKSRAQSFHEFLDDRAYLSASDLGITDEWLEPEKEGGDA